MPSARTRSAKPTPPAGSPGGLPVGDRDAAINFLKKRQPGSFRDPATQCTLEGVTTGSFLIDHVIGNGGFPRTKISEIFGPPSSGKSTLAASACAAAQAAGLYPVYVDVERGLERKYAERMGFDVSAALSGSKGFYCVPDTFEEMLEIVETMVMKGAADLIIVDSVPALQPKEAFEGDISELGKIGMQARVLANALPRLIKIIDRPNTRTALVFVNQIRANMGGSWGSEKYKAAGGYALEHYSSLRLSLKQIKKAAKVIEKPSLSDPSVKDKIPVASLHEAMTFKNKVSTPYRRIEFYIRYDPEANLWELDNLQTVIDIAVGQSVIESKGGGYYLYSGSDSMQVRGEPAVYEWFRARPDSVVEVIGKLGL